MDSVDLVPEGDLFSESKPTLPPPPPNGDDPREGLPSKKNLRKRTKTGCLSTYPHLLTSVAVLLPSECQVLTP